MITIDNFGPLPVKLPRSVEELGEFVREAGSKGHAIYPVGGRTMLDLGMPPTKPGVAIDTTALDQIIDYPARDMTITLQAGLTVQRLQEILRKEGQRLPIDVPQPERATIGGAIACNVSGPRRYGFGTLRDYVIGISVVNAEGQEVKAGGRVVKNVAGYDMCKLYTGSLGTLGIISQVTLKVRPIPEASAIVGWVCSASDLNPALERIHSSRTRPVCIELLSLSAAREIGLQAASDRWLLLVGFEDNAESVKWQVDQAQKVTEAGIEYVSTWEGPDWDVVWQSLSEKANASAVAFKANLLPRAVGDFCGRAAELVPSLQAHAGNGIVKGWLTDMPSIEKVQPVIQALRDMAVEAQGNLIVSRCPPGWKARVNVWGGPREDAWLMRAVKEQLDPNHIFNPDRFVAEI